MQEIDLTALAAERARLRTAYLRTGADRPSTTAGGVHHVALLCTNVERTIQFYQDLLEFPLTDVFENRDYKGSTHFFFDIGHGNALAFFDFPGLDLPLAGPGYATSLCVQSPFKSPVPCDFLDKPVVPE